MDERDSALQVLKYNHLMNLLNSSVNSNPMIHPVYLYYPNEHGRFLASVGGQPSTFNFPHQVSCASRVHPSASPTTVSAPFGMMVLVKPFFIQYEWVPEPPYYG
jgi:hypothetical protein